MDTTTEELIQRITKAESRMAVLEARDRPELITESFLKLPQLRGYWPLSAHRALGGANDLSGTGLNLTYNGNPLYTHSDWLTYLDLDGVGDFLSRADEAAFDILGTEAYVAAANRGLTMGGWFWLDSDANEQGLIGKYTTGTNQRSYQMLSASAAGLVSLKMNLSNNGVAFVGITSPTNSLPVGVWRFLVGRYIPSTEMKLWINEDVTTLAVGVPASLFNGTSDFRIGYYSAGSYLDGRAALCFLCAGVLSDNVIEDLFERTRWLFGV